MLVFLFSANRQWSRKQLANTLFIFSFGCLCLLYVLNLCRFIKPKRRKSETVWLWTRWGYSMNFWRCLLHVKFSSVVFATEFWFIGGSLVFFYAFKTPYLILVIQLLIRTWQSIKFISVSLQTGTGHFSPIGGYHGGRDMVLILDVARFKYPPHWVPLTLLWEAMDTVDKATGQSRGYAFPISSMSKYEVERVCH